MNELMFYRAWHIYDTAWRLIDKKKSFFNSCRCSQTQMSDGGSCKNNNNRNKEDHWDAWNVFMRSNWSCRIPALMQTWCVTDLYAVFIQCVCVLTLLLGVEQCGVNSGHWSGKRHWFNRRVCWSTKTLQVTIKTKSCMTSLHISSFYEQHNGGVEMQPK